MKEMSEEDRERINAALDEFNQRSHRFDQEPLEKLTPLPSLPPKKKRGRDSRTLLKLPLSGDKYVTENSGARRVIDVNGRLYYKPSSEARRAMKREKKRLAREAKRGGR